MPELPDVEVFKQYLDGTSLHKRIDEVTVKNKKILENTTAKKLRDSLRGKTLKSSRRHGKYLFANINDNGWLVLHFGMTGFLKYFKDMEKEPGHDRLLLSFRNGYHLAFDCLRMLGKVQVIKDFEEFLETKELGPDPLASEFSFDVFKERFAGRSGMIKTTLMNQQILAGIGNVYSDEILFQAGVYPKQKVNELPEKDLKNLYNKTKSVLETVVKHKADPEQLPDGFLLPNRHKDGKCPKGHGKIEKMKVSQRTAYYCPQCQKHNR